MRQLTFFKYATAVLLLLNASMIAFFILTKPGGKKGGPDGKQFQRDAIAILQLDQSQQATFSALAKGHSEEMFRIDDQQRRLLQPYFQSLIDADSTSDKAGILAEIQRLERRKIEYTHQHFEEIKALLNPAQQIHFGTFVSQALRIILKREEKGPPPPPPH